MTDKRVRGANGLVILTRNLRLADNRVIDAALREYEKIFLCFVINRRQFTLPITDEYTSGRALAFLAQSLVDLRRVAPVIICEEKDLTEIIEKCQIGTMFIGDDYSPYADRRLERYGRLGHIVVVNDLLITPYALRTYYKFTPFYRKVMNGGLLDVSISPAIGREKFHTAPVHFEQAEELLRTVEAVVSAGGQPGGRTAALMRLMKFNDIEDVPSQLSPYLRFGCISAREAYAVFGEEKRRQLIWRDFYFKILKSGYMRQFDTSTSYKNDWPGTQEDFEKWCQCKTPWPVVNAAMNELVTTGTTDNYMRMILACTLVREYKCNWKWGEAWFARHLIDYDWAQNAGNWLYFVEGVAWSMRPGVKFNLAKQEKEADAQWLAKWQKR